MTINEKFKEWACSLSGCDGGNINAPVWICGIEWGYNKNNNSQLDYYANQLVDEINEGRCSPSDKCLWKDQLIYPYGRSIAKLYYAILGKEVSDYKNIETDCNIPEIFKMNLFPIAFNNTDNKLWKKHGLDKLTGIEDKYLYVTWCFLHRYPTFSNMVFEKRPKLIIGTGISYLTDFFACFAGKMKPITPINIETIAQESSKGKINYRRFYWSKIFDQTLLVVVPFPAGSNGMNSDYLIKSIGSKIRELVPELSRT